MILKENISLSHIQVANGANKVGSAYIGWKTSNIDNNGGQSRLSSSGSLVKKLCQFFACYLFQN